MIKQAWGVIKGWRTAIFAGLLALSPILLEVLSSLSSIDLTPVLKENAPTVTAAIGVIVIILRVLTTTGLGESHRPTE